MRGHGMTFTEPGDFWERRVLEAFRVCSSRGDTGKVRSYVWTLQMREKTGTQ